MTTRGSYVYKPMIRFFGDIPKKLFFVVEFLQILMASEKKFPIAFRIQNTINKTHDNFFLHYLPKLYIGFKLAF